MVGTDHQTPRPWLGRVVLEANALQDDVELVIRSLAEHVAAAPTEGLPHWTGELRSGARANLLMGVGSNRTDVKVAAAVAERTLERLTEPVAALFGPAGDWPQTVLDLAWREVIRNSAHDSVCACSHDDVVAAVLHRYAEARHIGRGLVRRTLGRFGDSLAVTGAVVVNPSARPRGGMVELDLPGAGPADGLQLLSETPAEQLLHEIVAADAVLVVEREIFLHPALIELELEIDGARARGAAAGRRTADGRPAGEHDRSPGRPGRPRPGPCRRRRAHRAPRPGSAPGAGSGGRRARLRLAGVGPDAVGRRAGRHGRRHHAGQRPGHRGRGPGRRDLLDRRPRPARHDRRRRRRRGHLQLVTPRTRRLRRPGRDRWVGVAESGPVRGRIVVDARYRLPHHIEDQARVGEVDVAVQTTYELRGGEDFVRVSTTVDNQARDHRLRVGFPLPEPTDHSEAECAFTVVRLPGLEAEGGPTERPMSTFPSRRFVRAGGLTVAHEGLLEYELVDIADGRSHLLALTLLRCTGMLSQGPMTTRPLPAGPENPLEGPQLQGRQTVRYAVRIGDGDPYALVDDAFLPLQVATGSAQGSVPGDGQARRSAAARCRPCTGTAGRCSCGSSTPPTRWRPLSSKAAAAGGSTSGAARSSPSSRA